MTDWQNREFVSRLTFGWQARHRDLVRRLGFGDDLTEPMADNDTIVAWFEERDREAAEWREHERFRDECAVAGHPTDQDCVEHRPACCTHPARGER
jgi:hypothetical protein